MNNANMRQLQKFPCVGGLAPSFRFEGTSVGKIKLVAFWLVSQEEFGLEQNSF